MRYDSFKVLLIGGAGFIGSHTAKALLKKDVDPIIFDSFYQYIPTKGNDAHRVSALQKRFQGLEDVPVVRGNAAHYREILNAIQQYQPNAIIHLGGLPIANISNQYGEEAMIGLQATHATIQAIHDYTRVPDRDAIRFVYISSSTVYGDFENVPASEEHPRNPKGVYAGVKLAGEEITKSFCKEFKIPFIIIRPQAVYGPTDVNARVVQKFIESGIHGEEVEVRDPTVCADFTYIDDIAEGIALATTSIEGINNTFNMSRGEGRTLGELVEIVQQYFPSLKTRMQSADSALPRRGSLDILKARSVFGFDPKYSLEEGVKAYVQYYQEGVRV